MAQSVELLLDPTSEGRVRYQWQALHSAGLPSEYRAGDGSHRPHLTLLAVDTLPAEAEADAARARGRAAISRSSSAR